MDARDLDALDLADAFCRAIAARDPDAVAQLYAEETVVWHSHDRTEQDKAANIAFLRGFFEIAAVIRYSDIRRARTTEGFVQQHVIEITLRTGEQLEPRPVCMVVRVRDGRIVRIDEYLEARRVSA